MGKHKKENIQNVARLVPRGKNKSLEIVAIGSRRAIVTDLYVQLLGASWVNLILFVTITYLFINVIFAAIYVVVGDAIENARPGSFVDAFFFSVQTMATIGYGKMSPHGNFANIMVTVEALLGFAFIAVMTGLVFSKFSQPTSRLMFSEKAVIMPYEGVPHLMIRLANKRRNRIVNARAQMVMLRNQVSQEGIPMRRFIDLKLVRNQVPLLRLTWTVMHKLDDKSPLKNMTCEELQNTEVEIIVSLIGVDETLSQTIHARFSYIAEEILFDSVFEDVIERKKDKLEVRYDRFHETKPYVAKV